VPSEGEGRVGIGWVDEVGKLVVKESLSTMTPLPCPNEVLGLGLGTMAQDWLEGRKEGSTRENGEAGGDPE